MENIVAEPKLPKAIQAQLDEVEAYERQIAEAAASQQGNTETVEASQPEAEAPAAPVVQEPAPAPQKVEDEGFKKKYEVLMGKYNSEVPRMSDQLRTQNEQIRAMQEELQSIKNKPVEQKPKEALVTSKDEETFGADLIDVARRVAKDEFTEVLNRISNIERAVAQVAKVPEKIQQIESRQVQSEEEKFWGTINAKIPDWSEVDSNPDWVDFLGQKAQFSVKTYRELALEAINVGDVSAVVELVNHWKNTSGITQAEAAKNQIQQELQSQAQPGNKKASTTPATTKGRTWTGEEYSAAFDVRLTRTMSDAEIIALQSEAELAVQEGRVRW